jgi:hypothetical protein
VIVTEQGTVQVNPAAVVRDVALFEAALAAADRASGDAERQQCLTARFLGIDEVGDIGRVGLMLRENKRPGAANFHVFMESPWGGLTATTRPRAMSETGCLCLIGPASQQEPNLRMRLQRAGNQVSAFYSRDGSTWFPAFGPVTLPTLTEGTGRTFRCIERAHPRPVRPG